MKMLYYKRRLIFLFKYEKKPIKMKGTKNIKIFIFIILEIVNTK